MDPQKRIFCIVFTKLTHDNKWQLYDTSHWKRCHPKSVMQRRYVYQSSRNWHPNAELCSKHTGLANIIRIRAFNTNNRWRHRWRSFNTVTLMTVLKFPSTTINLIARVNRTQIATVRHKQKWLHWKRVRTILIHELRCIRKTIEWAQQRSESFEASQLVNKNGSCAISMEWCFYFIRTEICLLLTDPSQRLETICCPPL